MKALTFATLLLLVSAAISLAQPPQPDPSIPKIMLPSPQAASLGKFADIPVGLYTGTPSINIPLYELHEGDLTLPISLDYHASGIKVEENASWSGLGWAFNAGGVITRSIRGSRDEGGFGKTGWISNSTPTDYANLENITNVSDPYMGSIANGTRDMQPDLYYFNFAGRTGKFFFDSYGQVHTVPYQKIIISPLSGFTIVTEDGTKYIFSKTESTQTYGHCNGNYNGSSSKDITAWYLTQIVSARGDATINLEYETNGGIEFSYTYQTIGSETKKVQVGVPNPNVLFPSIAPVYCDNFVTVFNPARLTRIHTANIDINIVKGEERCDLRGDYRLKEIAINIKHQTDTILLKKYVLSHKYLNGTSLVDLSMTCNPTFPGTGDNNNYQTRLMLDKVTEFGPNDETGKIYQLSYITSGSASQGMPSRLSFNQDHWGYFNGENNDAIYNHITESFIKTLIPATSLEPGANREPDLSSTKVGTLSRITYPTGGYTDFDYELHDVNNIGNLKYTVVTPRTTSLGIQPNTQSLGQYTYSSLFEVSSSSGVAAITVVPGFISDCDARPCGGTVNPFCGDLFNFEIWRYDSGDSTFIAKYSDADDFQPSNRSINLTNGFYKIVHWVKSGLYLTNGPCTPYAISLKWVDSNEASVFNTGGLRIKQITDNSGGNLITRYFEYKDESGNSSGYAINYPSYSHDLTVLAHTYVVTGTGCVMISGTQNLKVFTSTTNQPLGTTQGSSAGYSMVTTYYDDPSTSHPNGANGKSVSKFTNPYDFPDLANIQATTQAPAYEVGNMFPFAPNDSQDYLRGLLLEKTDYRKAGGTYFKTRKSINTYLYHNYSGSPNYFELWSWKVGTTLIKRNTFVGEPTCGPGALDVEYDLLYPVRFKMRSGYYELSSTDEIVYDSNDEYKFITTNTSYTNSTSHLQPIQITKTASDGKSETRFMKYPSDFTATVSDPDPASVALAKLVQQNRIAIPVEERTVVDGSLVTGTLTKFKELSGKIQKDEVYKYRASKPILNPGATSIVSGQLQFEQFSNNQGYEKVVKMIDYDSRGNILAYQPANNITNSYLWDYNGAYPIAEVKNAVQADIAYTSFEADGSGNWSIASSQRDQSKSQTGSQCYNVTSGSISKTGLTASRTYVVSFWAYSGVPSLNVGTPVAVDTRNGWTLYRLTFSGYSSIVLSGNGVIDELRLHPSESQMTTYTYFPGIGIGTVADVNSIPAYYEYDSLGRLSVIKDSQGSVVKSYEYNYQLR